jgi:hypothetical protein
MSVLTDESKIRHGLTMDRVFLHCYQGSLSIGIREEVSKARAARLGLETKIDLKTPGKWYCHG